MPQLDQFTYFTQFIWLFVCFMSFYILLYNNGLPKVSRILKLRNLLVNKTQPLSIEHSQKNNTLQGIFSSDTARQLPKASADLVIKDSLNSCVSFLNHSVKSASEWCTQMVSHLNTNPEFFSDTSSQKNPLNYGYIKSVGEISLAQVIKHITLNRCTPFFSVLIIGDAGYANTSLNTSSNIKRSHKKLCWDRIYLLRMQRKIFQSKKPLQSAKPVQKKKRSQNA
jgi:hypothetical protein